MDFIAKVFVLALKCQTALSFPQPKGGSLSIWGPFPITNLSYGERKTEFQRTFFEPVVSKIMSCSEEKNFQSLSYSFVYFPLVALLQILAKKIIIILSGHHS